MKRAMVGSLAIHMLVLFLFLRAAGGGSGNGQGDGANPGGGAQGSTQTGEIIDKPIEVVQVTPEVEEKIALQDTKHKPRKRAKEQNKECPKFFGGIGITWNPQTQQIITVHKGYPAEAAGFQPGDTLTGASEPIEGEVGTPITIYLDRGGVHYIADLVRAKICVDETSNSNP